MSSVYNAVRYAYLILFAIVMLVAIRGLVAQRNQLVTDVVYTISVSISIGVALLGAYGSYKHNRTYLLTFALISLIANIMMAFSINYPGYDAAVDIIFLILALVQAELLRRGHR